jgi:hypothetical protein
MAHDYRPTEEDKTIRVKCDFFVDNGASLQICSCCVEESLTFGAAIGHQIRDVCLILSLSLMRFDSELIGPDEAEQLCQCVDSRRPQWVSDPQRQLRDILTYQDMIISALGLPINIYLVATHAPLFALVHSLGEQEIDAYFTCGSEGTTFREIIHAPSWCNYGQFMYLVWCAIKTHPQWIPIIQFTKAQDFIAKTDL